MELKVIRSFIGKVEGRTLQPGETIHTTDVERINAMVGRGYCVIVSLATESEGVPAAPENDGEDTLTIGGAGYALSSVKEALAAIGVNVAANAKEKGVMNALGKLTEEEAKALVEKLNAPKE